MRPALDWCIDNVSYVYDHHEHAVSVRLMDLQHDHHDLVPLVGDGKPHQHGQEPPRTHLKPLN